MSPIRKISFQDLSRAPMCDSAASKGPTFESDVVTASYECKNVDTGQIDRQRWSMRTVLPSDFRALCSASGLRIRSQFATFADAQKGAEDETEPRIYFIAPCEACPHIVMFRLSMILHHSIHPSSRVWPQPLLQIMLQINSVSKHE